MGAPVTWFEISSANSEGLREFYATAFDWKLRAVEGFPYALVDTGVDGAIRGGIGEAQGPNQVIFYIEVDDPQANLNRSSSSAARRSCPSPSSPAWSRLRTSPTPRGM